jgi:large subunit ribosomal protein L31e
MIDTHLHKIMNYKWSKVSKIAFSFEKSPNLVTLTRFFSNAKEGPSFCLPLDVRFIFISFCCICLYIFAKMVKAAKKPDVVTREMTIHMSKRVQGITFKQRAPRAIREIKKFAAAEMRTKDVRIDTDLNKFVWARGVKGVPTRLRVQLSRRRNEDEKATEKMYTIVTYVPCKDFHGKQTEDVVIGSSE